MGMHQARVRLFGVLLALLLVGDTLLSQATAQRQQTQNQVSIREEGNYRIIESNGIPDHTTGRFPNRNNPNRIQPQRNYSRVPLHPKEANRPTRLFLGPFGIALNGILFDPGAAEFWNRDFNSGWQYEALGGRINLGLDQNNAHVQPTGSYHYHGLPTGLLSRLSSEAKKVTLLGYAADGFPIYGPWGYEDPNDMNSSIVELRSGYRLKRGTRPSGPGGKYDGTFGQDYEHAEGVGDLDECNGRYGVTEEYPEGTYYYVITEDYPYIPRYWRGKPDQSFKRGPGGPPGGRPGQGGPGDRRGGPEGGRGFPGGPPPPPGRQIPF